MKGVFIMVELQSKSELKYRARQASDEIKPWVKIFARIGYIAKGIIFILVGLLSLLAACGFGNNAKGTSGVFASVASKPFGEVLLWLIAVGLVGYILWLLIQVFEIRSIKKKDTKSIFKKFSNAVSCAIYISLAYQAFSLAIHAGHSGNAKHTVTVQLLSTGYGRWVIGMVGIIIIGYGIFQMYSGWKEKFMRQFNTHQMNTKEVKATLRTGKLGLIARGIVFCVLGYFIIQMAITANPGNPKGLDGTLEKILQQNYGSWLLGAVSIGLILYGLFEILKGKNKYIQF
jgi:hypothetical protein